MIKRVVTFILCFVICSPVFSKNISGDWHNDLRTLFLRNSAIIYTINMRTFNAKDKNGNELIDENEESGNFINAIDELDNLSKMGINTIHLLPITPVGKIKAFGTAGSLYAMSGFDSINPQILSKDVSSNGIKQATRFIKECHKRNIRVIVDLPSCGSYDLYVEHPEYFIKDENNNPVVPLDWTDVRLFDCGTEKQINEDLLTLHKKYIDMVLQIGADGLRADVARLKSEKFWNELITYARAKDSEFLFLAEASNLWTEPVSKYALNTSVDKLFNAGFDGYLGSYFELKNLKTGKEFITMVQNDLKLFKKYNNEKTVIGSFSTHDEVSPVLINGANFSKMLIWLNTTLPLNAYYIDGFPTGDTYKYQWANKVATKSQTDDEYYFTHNGKIDIFNLSRKPGGKDNTIYDEFVLANKFKNYYAHDLYKAKFVPLKTSNTNVFAYARVFANNALIVIGNIDFKNPHEVIVKVPKLKPNKRILNLRVPQTIKNEYTNGKLKANMKPGDIQVLLIKNLVF
ncbi:MAG: hypothetical protein K6E29_06535 [Cyanobacteria bacterium RUI128]|nr:hypothetical protein [Cyanobacteria bacterium RUI128]